MRFASVSRAARRLDSQKRNFSSFTGRIAEVCKKPKATAVAARGPD